MQLAFLLTVLAAYWQGLVQSKPRKICSSQLGICPLAATAVGLERFRNQAETLKDTCEVSGFKYWTNCLFAEYSCFRIRLGIDDSFFLFGCIADDGFIPVVTQDFVSLTSSTSLQYVMQQNTSVLAVLPQNFTQLSRSCSTMSKCTHATVQLATTQAVAEVCCCKGDQCADVDKLGSWQDFNLQISTSATASDPEETVTTSATKLPVKSNFKDEPNFLSVVHYWLLCVLYATTAFAVFVYGFLLFYGRVQNRMVLRACNKSNLKDSSMMSRSSEAVLDKKVRSD